MRNIYIQLGREKKKVTYRLLVICMALATISIASTNPYLTVAGIALLPILFLLLWRPGEPPVLLFAAFHQWLQVFMPVLHANYLNMQIGQDVGLNEMQLAAWLGLGTILVLAIGIRIGFGSRWRVDYIELERFGMQLRPKRMFMVYVVFLLLLQGLNYLRAQFPPIAQIILVFELYHWAVVFIILWVAAINPHFRRLAIFVVAIELASGFLGFFSTFKTIVYLLVVVIVGQQIRRIRIFNPVVVAAIILVIMLGLVWQAVKVDYRYFLSQGTGQQEVLVTPENRVKFLIDRISNLESSDFSKSIETTVSRIGYIYYFARSIQTVPAYIPYQDGKLWGEAIIHILTPRLLFPEKPAISDSKRTNAFTGVRVATAEQGVSIGIGYAAESYIDYGPLFMFVPIFGLGMFWGWSYKLLATRSRYSLLGLAVATVYILKLATLFESSNIKLIGGSVTVILVSTPLLVYFSKWVWERLVGSKS